MNEAVSQRLKETKEIFSATDPRKILLANVAEKRANDICGFGQQQCREVIGSPVCFVFYTCQSIQPRETSNWE